MDMNVPEGTNRKSIEIFCCYARVDKPLLDQLQSQLSPLQREGLITVWSDKDIDAGREWENEIKKHLNSAQMILLFVSPDFMKSDYCFSIEMTQAMERHKRGEARVVPIILRPTLWIRAPFGQLQVLPTNAEPVTSEIWHTLDHAFLDVVQGIEKEVEELLIQLLPPPSPTNIGSQQTSGNNTAADGTANDRDRFDKFTERARKVLSLAQEEALRFQHNYIGTEHLLLGLVREGEGVAAKVLANLGVELDKIRRAVEIIIGRGDRIVLGEIGLTPRAKKVVELAVDEARRVNHDYIGTEHLLLGLVREGEGIAAGILESLGVKLEDVRTQTVQVLSQSDTRHGSIVKRSKTPNLDRVGVDLTTKARALGFNPIIGRRQEMDQVIKILSRRNKNNSILIGEPGVGKTALVEGLAQRLISGEVPETLAGKRLLTLDIGSLLVSTRSPSEREELLKKIIEEMRTNRNSSILFIDNVPELLDTDAIESMGNVAQIFKLGLSRGELQCLGTSTPESYQSMLKRDKALQVWFEEVIVREPTIEETIEILKGVREHYEHHHRLVLTDEALKAAAALSSRYILDGSLPSKAISLLDKAASQVRVRNDLAPLNLKEAMKGLESALREKEAAIQQQEYELAAELREREVEWRGRIARLEAVWRRDWGSKKPTVGEEDIVQIVSEQTDLPLTREARARLLQMEEVLNKRVVGQPRAIESIGQTVRRTLAGLNIPNRPLCSFLFVGPSSVGKTETAKVLAEFLFGNEDKLTKIYLSGTGESHTSDLAVGTSPDPADDEVSDHLIEAVRSRSAGIVLLDKIENASSRVRAKLSQILKDGKLTDAQGRTVDFRNTIIIMTSGIGTVPLDREASLGFKKDWDRVSQSEYDSMRNKVFLALRDAFRSDFPNYINEIIVFHSLLIKDMDQIADLVLNRIRTWLAVEQQIELIVPTASKDFLIKKGFDPRNGARSLHSTIQRMIENLLIEGVLVDKFRPGDLVEAVVIDGELVLLVRNRLTRLPPPSIP